MEKAVVRKAKFEVKAPEFQTGTLERSLRTPGRAVGQRKATLFQPLPDPLQAGLEGTLPIGTVARREGGGKRHAMVVPQNCQGDSAVARGILRGARQPD